MNKGYQLRKRIEAAKRRKIYNHNRLMTAEENRKAFDINCRIRHIDYQIEQIQLMIDSCNKFDNIHIVVHCGGYQASCDYNQQSVEVLNEMYRVISIERQQLIHELDTLTDAK